MYNPPESFAALKPFGFDLWPPQTFSLWFLRFLLKPAKITIETKKAETHPPSSEPKKLQLLLKNYKNRCKNDWRRSIPNSKSHPNPSTGEKPQVHGLVHAATDAFFTVPIKFGQFGVIFTITPWICGFASFCFFGDYKFLSSIPWENGPDGSTRKNIFWRKIAKSCGFTFDQVSISEKSRSGRFLGRSSLADISQTVVSFSDYVIKSQTMCSRDLGDGKGKLVNVSKKSLLNWEP